MMNSTFYILMEKQIPVFERACEIYDDGEMSSSQYDDLMSYIQDLQE